MPAPEIDLAKMAREALRNAPENDDDDAAAPDPDAGGAPPRKTARSATAADDDDPDDEPASPPARTRKSSTVVRDYLRENNFDLDDDTTDDDLLPEFVSLHEQNRKLAEELEQRKARDPFLTEYLQHRDDFQGFLKTRKKPEGEDAADTDDPEKPKKQKWAPPKYNPEWENRVKWDEKEARFIPRTQYDSPSVAEEANRWYAHQKAVQRRAAEDPWGLALEAGGEDYINQRIEEAVKKALAETNTTIQSKGIDAEIDEFLETKGFDRDEDGRLKKAGGKPAMSAAGKAYISAVNDALDLLGKKSIDELPPEQKAVVHRRAVRVATSATAEPEKKPKGKGQDKPNGEKPRFLNRIKRTPNRSGTVSRSEQDDEPQNDELDFKAMAMQELRELGAVADKG